jgi:hypothetical protein
VWPAAYALLAGVMQEAAAQVTTSDRLRAAATRETIGAAAA